LSFVPGQLRAQEVAASPAERDRIFAELLKDPTNADLNLRYAQISAKLGDVEGAIATLDRLLLINPDLTAARVQLGLLYTQIGSYDMARGYLQPVADQPDAPADIRAEAQQGLALANKLTSPHQYSLTLFFGVQSQTDPGAAPGGPVFLLSGVNTVLNNQFAKHADVDLFGQGVGSYSYDFQNRHGDKLELGVLGYASFFARQRALNLADGKFTLGPRLGLDRIGLDGGTFKAYGLGEYVELGESPYYRGYGGGLEYDQRLNEGGTRLVVAYEGEWQNYDSSNFYPTAGELTGRLDQYAVGVTQPIPIGIGSSVGLAGTYNRDNTRESFYNNDDYAVVASATIGYDAGSLSFGLPWVTSLSMTRHYIGYDGADPSVSKSIVRGDRRWQYSITQAVPVTNQVSVVGQLFRDVLSSNIHNYTYNNTSVLIGPQISF
jgi:tetratricopeptide (TPR) repeat protein